MAAAGAGSSWLITTGYWRDIGGYWRDNENWIDYETVLYTTYFIPLVITQNGAYFDIDQVGTNNPSLTCYRGTNYDFIVKSTLAENFALRLSAADTTTIISGIYNHDPVNGINSGKRIMFTPTSNTPNTIIYQAVAAGARPVGTITIKDYA